MDKNRNLMMMMMIRSILQLIIAILVLAVAVLVVDNTAVVEGFQTVSIISSKHQRLYDLSLLHDQRYTIYNDQQQQQQRTSLYQVGDKNSEDDNVHNNNKFIQSSTWVRVMLSKVISSTMLYTRKNRRFITAFTIITSIITGHNRYIMKMESCSASAPVMAIPKAEGRDPITEALDVHQRKVAIQSQKELNEFATTARKIEAEQGEAARIQYEKQYKETQIARAKAKVIEIEQLKRKLLEEGICPFTDMEGQRQVIELEKGIDLSKIQGTPFYLEKEWEMKNPTRSMKVKKAVNRKIIACMVQDMKNRNIDPLEYFQNHQDQTEAILDMKPEYAMRLLQQYEINLEEYGQITKPKEGEMSVKEKMLLAEKTNKGGSNNQRTKNAEEKAAAKAKADELKRIAKETKLKEQEAMKAAKIVAKEEANRIKEQAKKDAAQIAAAATAAATAVAVAAQEQAQNIITNTNSQMNGATTESSVVDGVNQNSPETEDNSISSDGDSSSSVSSSTIRSTKSESPLLTIVPKAIGIITVVGVSGYAVKIQKAKSTEAEEERRRQFQLLMEGSTSTTPSSSYKSKSSTTKSTYNAPALEVVTDNVSSKDDSSKKSSSTSTPSQVNDAAPPTIAKRLGIKSVFGKKKNDRATDLISLITTTSAPTFTTTLAKLLTFGAPGRFPSTIALPGNMPLETFDLQVAQNILIEQQNYDNLSRDESAEIFANVVNCMLIEIVDLAATALKEKDDQIKIDAINIVIDFMNHAASLYLSIAEGVTIKPVTYGGALSKSKLEDMYSIYAASALMNMGNIPEDFDNRVALLQDVFEINEKKAQGLMMKAMQKNMAEMLKSGKGMEGMEDMMKNMGGDMNGIPGMGPDGDGPSPEALKEMLISLKELKDSGSIPPKEFEVVKKQFQETFGSSVDDIVREADSKQNELSSTDKELLSLMKSIMD